MTRWFLIQATAVEFALLILLAVLTGCGTGLMPTSGPSCPALVTYSPEERAALAEEIDHLPPSYRHVTAALVEYAKLRAACR